MMGSLQAQLCLQSVPANARSVRRIRQIRKNILEVARILNSLDQVMLRSRGFTRLALAPFTHVRIVRLVRNTQITAW